MPLDTLASATDINRWANYQEARYRLPRLLRRLVHATVERIQRIGFPADEGVQLGGWDGIVSVETGSEFVPDGLSVWEMGVDRNVRQKADSDYEKRKGNPLGLDPKLTTFIFVTPRRWGAKDDWVADRQGEGFWREVRAYDADDLEQWLELASAVHIWLSILLGKRPENADDISTFWADWSEITRPALSSGLLTNGRTEAITRLNEWLTKAPSALALWADTREEAIAFFAAVLYQLPVEERIPYLSRSIVVKDNAAWNQLSASESALLLIPTFSIGDSLSRALRGGHHVYIPLGREDIATETAIDLPRLRVLDAREALQQMGFGDDRAGDLAPLARRSLMALRRKLAVNREVQQPKWARPEIARSLLPALMAGRWSESKDGDKEVVTRLGGMAYEDMASVLLRWANESDPPVRKIGETWLLVSKEDAWNQLSHNLSQDDLERFTAVVLDVLSEIDPSLDLPNNQRWMAGALGKSRAYSDHLREGLADTLAIMGARSRMTRWADALSAEERANRIVRQLLDRANDDWRLWSSLSHQLRPLAEAAPNEFLRAVEAGVSGDNPVLANLFEDTENDIFARSSHTGLLWSLELLAWSPDYLSRSALILAILARLDPGGKLTNRPANSLREIFLCWHPQTTANLEQRLRVLDMLRDREPTTSWQLMNQLLPEFHSIATPTADPHYRDWKPDEQSAVTYGELWTAERELISRMLNDAGTDGQRWVQLVEHLDDIHLEQFESVLSALAAIEPDALSDADRVAIWSALRALISRHREFPDADWVMSGKMLDRLDPHYQRFEPTNILDRFGWLFSHHPDLIGPFNRDWQARNQTLSEMRQAAVQVVYQNGGLRLILALADQVEQPGELGRALGTTSLLEDEEDEFLKENLGSDNMKYSYLAYAYVDGRLRVKQWQWAENKINNVVIPGWAVEEQTQFFISLPFASQTWDALPEGVRRDYWSKVRSWRVEPEDCARAIKQLLDHNRPHIALDFVTLHHNNLEAELSPNLAVEVLERAVRTSPEREGDLQPLIHHAGEILDAIEASEEVDESRVAHLEFALLPLLEHGRRGPKILHKELSTNPAFFMEVLCLVYKPEDGERAELSEMEVSRARLARDLLEKWRRIPGANDQGQIAAEELVGWVSEVRRLAAESNRRAITEQKIGYVFSSSPTDEDGTWPTKPVRDVVERQGSDELNRGFVTGVYNGRGGWSKAIAEGGGQERVLVERYLSYAAMVRDQWPRTASVLEDIAQIYSSEARRADIDAELEQDLWQ